MGQAGQRFAYKTAEEEVAHYKYLHSKHWPQIEELIKWRAQFFTPLYTPAQTQLERKYGQDQLKVIDKTLKKRYAQDTIIGYFIEKVSNENLDTYQPNWKTKMPEYRQEAARQGLDNFLFLHAVEGEKDALHYLQEREAVENRTGKLSFNMPNEMLKQAVERILTDYSDMKPGKIELSPLIPDVLPDWYLISQDDKNLGMRAYRNISGNATENKNIRGLAEIIDLTQVDLFAAQAAAAEFPRAYQKLIRTLDERIKENQKEIADWESKRDLYQPEDIRIQVSQLQDAIKAEETAKKQLIVQLPGHQKKANELMERISLDLEQEKRIAIQNSCSSEDIKRFVIQEIYNVNALLELYKKNNAGDPIIKYALSRLNANLIKLTKYHQSI